MQAFIRNCRIQPVQVRCRTVQLQDSFRQGAGVFHVNVNGAVQQGFVTDQGAAQAELPFNGKPPQFQHLRDDLSQQVPFIEIFAADGNLRCGDGLKSIP